MPEIITNSDNYLSVGHGWEDTRLWAWCVGRGLVVSEIQPGKIHCHAGWDETENWLEIIWSGRFEIKSRTLSISLYPSRRHHYGDSPIPNSVMSRLLAKFDPKTIYIFK